MIQTTDKINIIGGGLAGCEAAWQAAKRGVHVTLYEMKPIKRSPAHKTDMLAELVCSNSLRSNEKSNAVGLLKEEMRMHDSLIMSCADAAAVPAGSALAVDRDIFSSAVTERIKNNPLITVAQEEITEIDDSQITVIATGPLTSDSLSEFISENYAKKQLHFYDAAAPIVDASTINKDIAFFASRYGKGEASYLNCPMTKEQYDTFYDALVSAQTAKLHSFDEADPDVFEGCMPVEVMAKRGRDTLTFGPMKPKGLPDPKTGKEYYAVVQLRQENAEKTMYNIVGFQTHLTFGEQKRVFRMIPGLENAEFLRYGVMHRNTFIDSPRLLSADYSLRNNPDIFFAGQITGVEGYVESAASGLAAGINAANRALGKSSLIFPRETVIGSMAAYVSDASVTKFQPMNANFGLVLPLEAKVKGGKRARHEELASRSIEKMKDFIKTI